MGRISAAMPGLGLFLFGLAGFFWNRFVSEQLSPMKMKGSRLAVVMKGIGSAIYGCFMLIGLMLVAMALIRGEGPS